jgi:hypothetical protein
VSTDSRRSIVDFRGTDPGMPIAKLHCIPEAISKNP